jgi:membrane fusion protein, multidrug efflux system
MAASAPAPTTGGSSPSPATHTEAPPAPPKRRWEWLKYVTPILVLLLAAVVVISLTRNWNAWEGGKAEQVTDDAYVRGDLTPLSTRVSGIVRDVKVSDYQRVRSGDVLVELQDDDYKAQLAQATAGVEAAKAGIENNRRQRDLQDARIQRALAGIDQANAQIAAAEAGINAVQADVIHTQQERARQESLLATQATTKQTVEGAVANEQRFAAQAASRKAELEQAKTGLKSNEIAVEAERRSKAVLESQEQQLIADLLAKEASLNVA